MFLAALIATVPAAALAGQPAVSLEAVESAVTTSLARELVFALQHTIHHQAIIAVLLQQVGVQTPARFGYAPATPR